MAKVKLPGISIGLQGNLSPDIYYRKRALSSVACNLVPPTNPRTAAQLANRECFRVVPAHWFEIKQFAPDVASWELMRHKHNKGGSAYNEFCRQYKNSWANDPPAHFLRNFHNWHVYKSIFHNPPQPDREVLRFEVEFEALSLIQSGIYFYFSPSFPNVMGAGLHPIDAHPAWYPSVYEYGFLTFWPYPDAYIWCVGTVATNGIAYSGLWYFKNLQVE